MSNLDYEKIASEWIRVMRGKRSQPQLSRMLGYASNTIYTWESGRRFPTAAVAMQMLRISKIDEHGLWSAFFSTTPEWVGTSVESREGVVALLNELKGELPIKDLVERTGFSRFSISRWLRGLSDPKLPEFFAMIDAMSLRLLDLLALTCDIRSLPSAVDAWNRVERARRIAFEMPWSHAVLRVLELDDYRGRLQHDERFVAQMIGVSREEVRRCIDALAETGQIKMHGKHWQADAVMTIDTRLQPGNVGSLKGWWTEIGRERMKTTQTGQFSYNLFTVSEADFEKIRALHLSYFRALRAIVSESSPAEKVAVVNLHLFDLSENA